MILAEREEVAYLARLAVNYEGSIEGGRAMTFRRRNWWFRRFALGLAFAAFAAPAAAQPDENAGSTARTVTVGGWTGAVNAAGIPLSAGIPSGDEPYLVDPYLTDVQVRQGESLRGPDGIAADLGAAAPVQANESAAPAPAAERGWAVSRDGAIAFGLGALALALALGLAFGYARRPRIAGL